MQRISFRIDPLFIVLAVLLGWLNSHSPLGTVLFAIVVFISVLFHEMGHALAACAFGQKAHITLMALGGLTEREGPHINRFKEFLIVLNGPLFGFLLWGISSKMLEFPAVKASNELSFVFSASVLVNLFWTLINLTPVLPLDGGKLLQILFQGVFGVKGVRISYYVSLFLSVCLAVFFLFLGALLAGAIFLMFAFESYRGIKASRLMTEDDERFELKEALEQASEQLSSGHVEKAKELFSEIRKKTPRGLIHDTATLYHAEILMREGNAALAYKELLPLEEMLDVDLLEKLQKLAFDNRDFETVVRVGKRVFEERESEKAAILNAFAEGKLNQTIPAVGWFETACRLGLKDPLEVLSDPSFDSIRESDEFKALIEEHRQRD